MLDVGRLDDAGISDADRLQRPFKIMAPEVEEFAQSSKVRCDVVVLPDVGLENAAEVRQAIGNLSRCETPAAKLFFEIVINSPAVHARTPFRTWHKTNSW
jgi:hypothetical protein